MLRRPWPLPPFPMSGMWHTLHDYPTDKLITFLRSLVLCQNLPDKLLHFNVDLIRRSSTVDLSGCISFVSLARDLSRRLQYGKAWPSNVSSRHCWTC